MYKKILYVSVLLLLISIYGFFSFGNYLDLTQKPVKSDLIVCLGGGKDLIRIKKSLELHEKGYARSNVLLVTGGTAFTQKDHLADGRMAYLDKQEKTTSVIYNPYTKNTAEEIQFLKKYMNQYEYKTALIVSEPPYTRRIRMLVDIFDVEQDHAITIVSSEPSWWHNEKYYLNRHAKYMALSELVKIPYNYILYGILDKFGYLSNMDELEERFKIREYFHAFIKKNLGD